MVVDLAEHPDRAPKPEHPEGGGEQGQRTEPRVSSAISHPWFVTCDHLDEIAIENAPAEMRPNTVRKYTANDLKGKPDLG